MHTVANAAATIFSIESGTPPTTSGSAGNGEAIRPGSPANTTVAAPRMKIPTPRVSMISESSELPISGRSTTRLKTSANATSPAHPAATAPPSPSPNV